MTDGRSDAFVHTLTIEVDPGDSEARLIERSLSPEAADLVDDRSRTTVDRSGGRLRIHIEATDLVALRAAMNTWMGLLSVAESTRGTNTARC